MDIRWTAHPRPGVPPVPHPVTFPQVSRGARSVWDMFRPARLVSNVRVLTRRDVNVEKLRPEDTMRLPE